MTHVSEDKKKSVAEFAKLLDTYPVIAVVDMANLPTKTVSQMRAKLRENGTILKMTKKRLMKIAFSQAKKDKVKELEKYFKGMPALIFTKDNPFKLYSFLEKNKSNAPAKAGQVAPKDIMVKAGPTSFAPGPIIGQLGKYGIKTGVEGGKLAIKTDAVAAKKGQVIDADLAGILVRLGIEPMEIGLDLTAAYEDGFIFTSDVLYVDEKVYGQKFVTAYTESINLAVYSGYPTTESLKIMIGKAAKETRAISLEAGFMTVDTSGDIIKKAYRIMLSISNSLPPEALSEELRNAKNAAQVTQAAPEAPKAEKKEAKKEEDSAAGLGSLFG